MNTDINEVEINGIKYIRKGAEQQPIQTLNNASLVRCESAGVFYGTVEEHHIMEGVVEMTNARRVWYWSGAASLSQLAVDGTCKPKECKFPVAVPSIILAKVIEVIPMTQKALDSLNSVAIWKQ